MEIEYPHELDPSLRERDWQAELPFIKWTDRGSAIVDYDAGGKPGIRIRDEIELPEEVAEYVDGTCLRSDAPVLQDYRRFRDYQFKKYQYENMVVRAEIAREAIEDISNSEPFPLSVRRENPHLIAWLIGEKPDYAPAVAEKLVILPAYMERLRRLKEQGLLRIAPGTESQVAPPQADGPCGNCQWRLNGEVLNGTMQVGAWKMVKHLWEKADRKASFDELLMPVYNDLEHIADERAFGSLRRAANNFFQGNGILLIVSIKKATVSLQSKK